MLYLLTYTNMSFAHGVRGFTGELGSEVLRCANARIYELVHVAISQTGTPRVSSKG